MQPIRTPHLLLSSPLTVGALAPVVPLALLACLLMLTGCGGGGGGSIKKAFTITETETVVVRETSTVVIPEQDYTVQFTAATYPELWLAGEVVTPPSVSAVMNTQRTDGVEEILEDGSQDKPFRQETLTLPKNNITDPGAFITTNSGALYNLTWGTPDTNGPLYSLNHFDAVANNFKASYTEVPTTIWGLDVTGSDPTTGPNLIAPETDVINAWRGGWTGRGVNVLVIDEFYDLLDNNGSYHGQLVGSIVRQYAPGANIYGIPWEEDLYFNSNNILGYEDGERHIFPTTTAIHASNLSFSYGLIPEESLDLEVNFWVSAFKGVTGFKFRRTDLTDSVAVLAAGNDTLDTGAVNLLAKSFAEDLSLSSRTLIVGAIRVDPVTGTREMASYSNLAGANTAVQNRFLVANGDANYVAGEFVVTTDAGSFSQTAAQGTSFAAPRVTAYAAILRQKFPNITGAQAASILLDTARTDTLSCDPFPGCDPAIYGQGEASLSRALAPVGRLR